MKWSDNLIIAFLIATYIFIFHSHLCFITNYKRFLTAPTTTCPMTSLACGQTIFSLPPVNYGCGVLCDDDNTIVIIWKLCWKPTYRCAICCIHNFYVYVYALCSLQYCWSASWWLVKVSAIQRLYQATVIEMLHASQTNAFLLIPIHYYSKIQTINQWKQDTLFDQNSQNKEDNIRHQTNWFS